MTTKMKTFLKVLGWIFVGIAVLGGPQVMVQQNFAWPSLAAELFWAALAWLCFAKSKKKETDEKNEV